MARLVSEVMNPELVAAPEGMSIDIVRDLVLALGITAVPILDSERHPRGVLSLRDMLDGGSVRAASARPPVTVRDTDTVDDAAVALARTDLHHMVVIDAEGRAVGMVSAVDLLRGLTGVPARHPAGFPHLDPQLRVSWTDDESLDLDRLGLAPEGAGVLVLVRGGKGRREQPVWAEGCERVRTRLEELLTIPQTDEPSLAALLEQRGLRYRAASVPNESRRAAVVRALRERLEHLPLPASVMDR